LRIADNGRETHTKGENMKKSFAVVAVLIASLTAFTASALSKPKAPKPQPVQTGPRQFIQSLALSNGVGATVTIVADWSEEANIQTVLSNVLSGLAQIDTEINGASEGEVSKINALSKGEKITLSNDMFALLSKAVELSDDTKGWFDITNKNYRKISLDEKDMTLTLKGNDIRVDVTNILPAYLVDAALAKLIAEGVANAKIEVGNVNRNIGQDIYTQWNVSVDIPNPNSVNAYRSFVYSFSNKAVASVRNNEAASDNFKNVTVFGGDSMTASAFAVALYELGPKYAPAFAAEHPEVKGIFVDSEGKLSSSRDILISHPDYAQEQVPTAPAVDRGPNDIRQKQREESRE